MTKQYAWWRDSTAVRSFAISGLLVGTIAAASWKYMLPRGSEIAVLAIFAISVLVAALGVLSTIKQIRQLGKERRTLTQLATADLVQAVSRRSPDAEKDPSNAVVLRYATLVSTAIYSGAVPPGDYRNDWRRQAVERSAGYGAIQRFFASTLLLLAVLGTFAGMKSALPYLSRALGGVAAPIAPVATSERGLTSNTPAPAALGVTTALDLVANAFGSNFTALLGSLLLASLGYGLTRDRRSLLTELDDVASRSWYPALHIDAGLSTLERAVVEMRGSVSAVASVGDSMATLNRRLESFTSTLVESMQHMVGDVRATMLANSRSADHRQDSQMTEIVRSLALITAAFDRATIGYEGLVKGLQERDLGVGIAAKALTVSSEEIDKTGTKLSEGLEELKALRKQVSRREGEYQQRFSEVATALQVAGAQVSDAVTAQAAGIRSAGDVLTSLDTEQRAGWSLAAKNNERQLDALQSVGERLTPLNEILEISRREGRITNSELMKLRGDVEQVLQALMRFADQLETKQHTFGLESGLAYSGIGNPHGEVTNRSSLTKDENTPLVSTDTPSGS